MAQVDYFKRYGAGARPLTLKAFATSYLAYNASADGDLDQFLASNPQIMCAGDVAVRGALAAGAPSAAR